MGESPEVPQEAKKAGRGRKRKTSEGSEGRRSTPSTPSKRGGKAKKVTLSWEDFAAKEMGDRVLSCGEGEQLGHPGRTTTRKPRKVDIVEEEEMKIRQVVAGGVHSLFLTDDHRVFSCGMNEKGTVPAEGVEAEASTDEFTEIKLATHIPGLEKDHGKVVMLTAGASFTAALTDKGSVLAWGNLRDQSGEIDVHPLLKQMQEKPVVIINHKKRVIVKVAAGENHLAMLSEDGHLLTFGDGTMGQLGRSRRTANIRSKYMVDESGEHLVVKHYDKKRKAVLFKNMFASGNWTLAEAQDDSMHAFGLNNYGQLGTPFEDKEEEMKEKKEEEQEEGVEKMDEGDDQPKAAPEAVPEAPQEDERDFRVYKPTEAGEFEGRGRVTHAEGVHHIAARTDDGSVYGIGKNVDNALGLGTWTGKDDNVHWRYTSLQKVDSLPEGKMAGVSAKLGASVAWTEEGTAWSWGYDSSGQLGLGITDDDEKVVSKPAPISSAHLDGYRIISASVADNHTLFVAKRRATVEEEEKKDEE